MPAYSNTFPPYSISHGDQQQIVSNEQLGATNFSQRVAIADKDVDNPAPVTLTFAYASAPAAVEYDIYVAWDDVLTSYRNIGKSTNVNGEDVTIQRVGPAQINFRFICVKEVVSPGVNATVTARK